MRWIAVDIHKNYALVVEQPDMGKSVSRRVPLPEGLSEFVDSLRPDDQVVMEASTSSFRVAEMIGRRVTRVVVSDSAQTRGAVSHPAMTDLKAAEALVKLLRSDFVREVWVPPAPIRSLRSLIDHFVDLNKHSVATKNRIRSLLHQELIKEPVGLATVAGRRILDGQFHGQPEYRFYLCSLLRLLKLVEDELGEVEKALGTWCRSSPEAKLLMTIPGVGLVLSSTLMAQIGDIKRFDSPRKLCSYAGLVPRVHFSGKTHRTGGISRSGRRLFRWALNLVAWQAVRRVEPLKIAYENICSRRPKMVAQVAIQRKLLTTIWHMLQKKVAFREEDTELSARKELRLQNWPELSPEALVLPSPSKSRPSVSLASLRKKKKPSENSGKNESVNAARDEIGNFDE